MSGPMDHLIKERKRIDQTLTKFADPTQTERERHALEHVSRVGIITPELISSTSTTLTMEYFSGPTVFRVLEILSQKKRHKDIEKLLESMIKDLLTLQKKSVTFESELYPYKEKMLEIVEMLILINEQTLADKILNNLDELTEQFTMHANIPFRDATPKNHILLDQTESFIKNHGLDEGFKIAHFDFATLHMRTHQIDDIISILYHYMISDEIREKLLRKYNVGLLNNDTTLSTTLLRLGRFWLRRVYYQKYHESLFKKRYRYESINFYTKHFFNAIKRI